MTIFIEGLRLGDYRGIGKTQEIAPLKRFNFFASANNSGKSTILDFLARYGEALSSNSTKAINLPYLDQHRESGKTHPVIAVGIERDEFLDKVEETDSGQTRSGKSISDFFYELSGASDLVWFEANEAGKGKFTAFKHVDRSTVGSAMHSDDWYALWKRLTGHSGGGLLQHHVPETLSRIDGIFSFSFPSIHLLPAVRQIGDGEQAFEGLGGEGLIGQLQRLQNPSIEEQENKTQFEKLNHLLQTVLGKPDAEIEIPHNREAIIVRMDGKALPLSSLGTGIEEVIMIGAYCTIYDGTIMCLEEPELHLHPILQRQLLSYLKDNTTSQYFVSTHSAAFIDMPEGRIFQVENDGSSTTIRSVSARASRRLLSDRLGYRASDVVQANSVIWVEGPSDRIYIKQWLKQVDPELVEGIDYSIMFYGGRLLSHLTGEEDLVADFINLKALNQNSAIILDSDRPKNGARYNATKMRILSEYKENSGFAWITQGREIENYLDAEKLHEALKLVHPTTYQLPNVGDEFANRMNCLRSKSSDGTKMGTAEKVKVAQKLVEEELNLDVLDLKKQINGLAAFIRKANHR
ncbi:AAA family ATPase [uncultured Sulfitobacter sp.]|uniref:AAA family ATPase n=1 Tax=uncultured Sulfitobacter sp. TaxID=191468 RepID=UPI00261FCFD4|nr:AAA family ATPase [uncultured Sulfitobacter sp.]